MGVFVGYRCSRRGFAAHRRTILQKRHGKMYGSSKIEFTCPAHISVHKHYDGSISGTYVAKHFCHNNKFLLLSRLRLSNEDRCWIAGKL
jgi:hypothetical protein